MVILGCPREPPSRLTSSVVQEERGGVAEPLFGIETGPSSSALTGGVMILPKYLILPCEDPLRFFLELGHVEGGDRL